MPNLLKLLNSVQTHRWTECWNVVGDNRVARRASHITTESLTMMSLSPTPMKNLIRTACITIRAVVLAGIFGATGFLTGCLEGSQRRYNEYNAEPPTGTFQAPVATGDLFSSPLAYPHEGAFALKFSSTISVRTIDELKAALASQTGPLVITIEAKLRLNETLFIKFPVIIQTLKGIGAPDSELDMNYQPDPNQLLPRGRFVVNEPDYVNSGNFECAGNSDRAEELKKQFFFTLNGRIKNAMVDLRSPVHFVFFSSQLAAERPNLTILSHRSESTIFVYGERDSKPTVTLTDFQNFVRFAAGPQLTYSPSELNYTSLHALMLNEQPEGLTLDDAGKNVCYSETAIESLRPEGMTSWVALLNQITCQNGGWFEEIEIRKNCADDKRGAK